MVREIVNRVVPGFLKPYVPVAMLPPLSKTVGLGSWAAVGGVFAFFLVQVRLRPLTTDSLAPSSVNATAICNANAILPVSWYLCRTPRSSSSRTPWRLHHRRTTSEDEMRAATRNSRCSVTLNQEQEKNKKSYIHQLMY